MSIKAVKNWNKINDKLKTNNKDISKSNIFLGFNKGFLNLHSKAGNYINDLKVYEIGKVVFNRSEQVNHDGIIDRYIINGLNANKDYNDNEIIITYKP